MLANQAILQSIAKIKKACPRTDKRRVERGEKHKQK